MTDEGKIIRDIYKMIGEETNSDTVRELVSKYKQLQQEKEELMKWLKEEAETYRFRENYEELSMTGACEMILKKLGE